MFEVGDMLNVLDDMMIRDRKAAKLSIRQAINNNAPYPPFVIAIINTQCRHGPKHFEPFNKHVQTMTDISL